MNLTDLQHRLDRAENFELAGPARVIVSRFPSVAIETLLPVLHGPVRPGIEYGLHSLISLDVEPDESFHAMLAGILLGSSAEVAKAGARLALELVKRHRLANAGLLTRSFEHWQKYEQPYPKSGGVVPPSPRQHLLEALLVLDTIGHRCLTELLQAH